MKPNMMSNEELALLIEQGPESELSYEEISEAMVEICSRLRAVDAIKAKIKGMIERPTVELVEVNIDGELDIRLMVSDQLISSWDEWHRRDGEEMTSDLTKALGMEEDSTTDAQEQK